MFWCVVYMLVVCDLFSWCMVCCDDMWHYVLIVGLYVLVVCGVMYWQYMSCVWSVIYWWCAGFYVGGIRVYVVMFNAMIWVVYCYVLVTKRLCYGVWRS